MQQENLISDGGMKIPTLTHETHDERKRNVNHYFRDSNFGLNTNHIPKIDMRNFDGKDPVTWIL